MPVPMTRKIAARDIAPGDYLVHGALASGFVIKLLEYMYDDACTREGTSHKDVVAMADWRNAL